MSEFKNRIIGEDDQVDPEALMANPFNYRIHSHVQQNHMDEVLAKVGWVQRILVNQRTGHVIDGHMRVVLAMRRGEKVPVTYVDLDESEEKLILATFDWIGGIAGVDTEQVEALTGEIADLGVEAVEAMRLDLGIEEFDPDEEWDDMPEMESENLYAFKTIKLHFTDEAAMAQFSELIGVPLTEKSKSAWFPEPPISDRAEDVYE